MQALVQKPKDGDDGMGFAPQKEQKPQAPRNPAMVPLHEVRHKMKAGKNTLDID